VLLKIYCFNRDYIRRGGGLRIAAHIFERDNWIQNILVMLAGLERRDSQQQDGVLKAWGVPKVQV
jgi:hypothetical protein